MDRITIHICTRDRWSEFALLLQSLRSQNYQEFDLIISVIDDITDLGYLPERVVRLLKRAQDYYVTDF